MHVRAARPDDAEALRTAVSRAREATVFDDIGAPLLDVSAAGVREAAAEAEWSFLMEDEEGPVGVPSLTRRGGNDRRIDRRGRIG